MAPHEESSSEARRRRLGTSVRQARRALGYRSHRTFAAAVGVSERSIFGLEKGESGVGTSVMESVGFFLGQHLRGWSVDAAREVLDGAPPPALELVDPERPSRARLDVAWNDARTDIAALATHSAEAKGALRRVVLHWRERFHALGMDDSDVFTLVSEALKEADKAPPPNDTTDR